MKFIDTQEKAEPGETIRVWGGHLTGDQGDTYAEFIEYQESEWTDITEGCLDEFTQLVGEDWVENHDGGLLAPDMVVSDD